MKVSVNSQELSSCCSTLKNTFVHCAFDEETDGGSTALACKEVDEH
jgi:hypothetical protein